MLHFQLDHNLNFLFDSHAQQGPKSTIHYEKTVAMPPNFGGVNSRIDYVPEFRGPLIHGNAMPPNFGGVSKFVN